MTSMTRSGKPYPLFSGFPPLWVVGLLFAYLIAVSVLAMVLSFATNISDNDIEIFVLPVLEETLKLWLVLKLSKHAFGAIVTFGILELVLVKAPFLVETQGIEDAFLLLITALIVFGFHVATALAYRSAADLRDHWFIFGLCVTFHIIFNLLSILDLSSGAWVSGAILICVAVVGAARLVARMSSRTDRT